MMVVEQIEPREAPTEEGTPVHWDGGVVGPEGAMTEPSQRRGPEPVEDDLSQGAGPVEDVITAVAWLGQKAGPVEEGVRTAVDQKAKVLEDRSTTNLLDMKEGPPIGGAARKMRMITDVLMEPRKEDAPTKRRRGRGKRSTCPKNQGTLQKYFSKLVVPKEMSVANSMVEGANVRKRKGETILVEDHKRLMLDDAPRCLLMEDDRTTCRNEDSRTLCPIFMGAKSRNGRETDGQKKISGNGLDLFALTSKEGATSLGLDEKMTENHINSQRF